MAATILPPPMRDELDTMPDSGGTQRVHQYSCHVRPEESDAFLARLAKQVEEMAPHSYNVSWDGWIANVTMVLGW